MPSLYEAEARPERLSPAHRVQRLKQRRRRFAIVTTLAVVLVVALAARAWAWHIGVNGSADCDQTTVSITVPDEPWAQDASATGTVDLAGQSKSWAKVGAGTTSVSFPGVNGGTATVSGEFNTGEPANGSVAIATVADCEQEEQPPVTTTPPPTSAPPAEEEQPPAEDDKPQGSSTSTKRSEPSPDDSIGAPTPPIEEAPVPATPGTLPLTGPREDMQRAMLLSGLALVLAGVALLVTIRRRPAVAVERGWGETRVRPDRDSADANLLATLFGRRGR